MLSFIRPLTFSLLLIAIDALPHFPSPAHAVLIDLAQVTRDTDTGLDWLDISATLFLSPSTVVSQMEPGGPLEGFRYATSTEVYTLWMDAGIPNIPGLTGGNYGPIVDLILMITPTNASGGERHSAGYALNPDIPGGYLIPTLAHYASSFFGFPAGEAILSTGRDNPYFGSWLVHDTTAPVPEPSTWLLFGSGLAGLAAWRRRCRV